MQRFLCHPVLTDNVQSYFYGAAANEFFHMVSLFERIANVIQIAESKCEPPLRGAQEIYLRKLDLSLIIAIVIQNTFLLQKKKQFSF